MFRKPTIETNDKFLPQHIMHYFPADEPFDLLAEELECRAVVDPSSCAGYMPGLPYADNTGMPYSKSFAARHSRIVRNRNVYDFSFLRLSLVKQEPLYGLHVDSNAKTGIGRRQAHRQSWRMLLNLGQTARTMTYSTENIANLKLTDRGNLWTCENYNRRELRSAVMLPRYKHLVHGIVFCASHVLHGGEDDENGHFIASYGLEI